MYVIADGRNHNRSSYAIPAGYAAYPGAFLLIFGAKMATLHYAANYTPFWDEWDGDAAFLLRPYLEGNLTIADLFQPHNEHRILFTRLATLAIFNISGYWDVVLQMIVNAIIHGATIVATVAALTRILEGGRALASLATCAAFAAIPFGWENTLLGFNTHFYLLLTFSFVSLYCLAGSRAWSMRWLLGTLLALASFLCMASGALTLAGAIGLYSLQLASGRRTGFREWLGVGAHVAIVLALIWMTPTVASSAPSRAHTAGQFLAALLAIASWPSKSLLGPLVYLPAVAFLVRTLKDRPEISDARWFNVAALGWVAAQYGALAFGRAAAPLSSRYLDLFLMGVAISFISALWLLAPSARPDRRRTRTTFAIATWLVMIACGLALTALTSLRAPIESRRDTAAIEASNLRGYLATGEYSYLADKPLFSIPYPSAERLRDLLDIPTIRSALPPELTSQDLRLGPIETLKRSLLRCGYAFIGAGLLLLAAAAAGLLARKRG